MIPLDQYTDIDTTTGFDDDEYRGCMFVKFSVIKYALSTAWGSPERALSRALATPTTSKENQALLRTYHPAFIGTKDTPVGIGHLRDGSRIWVVSSLSCLVPCTHAGGLRIHVAPDALVYAPPEEHVKIIPSAQAPLARSLNPKCLLSNRDLSALRHEFPHSCGCRIWLSGCVEVLYSNKWALKHDYWQAASKGLPGRVIVFSVLSCSPSGGRAKTGDQVVPEPISSSSCSLGLRLVLPDGTPALTTVTHGFVRQPQTGIVGRAMDCFWLVKDTLLKFRSPREGEFDLPYTYVRTQDMPTSNTSLGKEVFLSGQKERVGSITQTFDSPSHVWPYPSGYKHDLSLITGTPETPVPFLDTPAGFPSIDEWAAITEALKGEPLFVTSTVAYTDRDKAAHGTVLGSQTRQLLQTVLQQAAAEGTQYLWDKESMSQSVSLLWRCVPDPKDLAGITNDETVTALCGAMSSVRGISGSILCLGRPTDATVKALVFQNFEIAGNIHGDERLPLYNIKGGFLLPSFVYTKCTIDCVRRCAAQARSIERAAKDF